MDGPPYSLIVHLAITVDQRVTHCDRPAKVRQTRRDFRRVAREAPKCLTNDLQLTFHRGTQHRIREAVVEVVTLDKGGDAVTRLAHVPQPCAGIMLHRQVAASV